MREFREYGSARGRSAMSVPTAIGFAGWAPLRMQRCSDLPRLTRRSQGFVTHAKDVS